MFDQLQIGNKLSFDDFEASIKNRKIGKPAKKSIKEQIPYSNVTYDFSAIDGEIYWDERELSYVFEIIADTPELLEEKKRVFASWIMNTFEAEIRDPFIKGYYFRGTYMDMNEDDDESVEKTTITVTFSAYPYMIADSPTAYAFLIEAGVESSVLVINNSSHRISPEIQVEVPVSIRKENTIYSISAGTSLSEPFKLEPGRNVLVITAEENCNIVFLITEEVF